MQSRIANYFGLEAAGTTLRREVLAGVTTFVTMSYIIGVGITAGMILYPLFKLAAGRYREVHAGLWILYVLSVLFYLFYPYQ